MGDDPKESASGPRTKAPFCRENHPRVIMKFNGRVKGGDWYICGECRQEAILPLPGRKVSWKPHP